MLLLTGIVFTVVPLLIMIGFAIFIFVSFMRDDDDAGALLRLALIVMTFGLILIGVHFIIN